MPSPSLGRPFYNFALFFIICLLINWKICTADLSAFLGRCAGATEGSSPNSCLLLEPCLRNITVLLLLPKDGRSHMNISLGLCWLFRLKKKKPQQTNNYGLVLSPSFLPSGNQSKHHNYNNKRFNNFIKSKGTVLAFQRTVVTSSRWQIKTKTTLQQCCQGPSSGRGRTCSHCRTDFARDATLWS